MIRGFVGNLLGLGGFPGSRRFAAANLVDSVGSGLLLPMTVLFFTIHVGFSPASVGLGLTVGGVIALAFAPIGGMLIDSFGAKPVLLAYWVLAALAYVGYGLVHTWAEFLPAVTVAEIAGSASNTARKSLLTEVAAEEDRVRLLSAQRSLRNVGFAIGGLLASAALAIGGSAFLWVVYGDAVSYALAILVVAGLRVPARRRDPDAVEVPGSGLKLVLADRRYIALTALDFFSTFTYVALEVALPLWIVLHTRAPRALTGILFTANTVIVVLTQMRVSASIRGVRDLPRVYRRAAAAIVGAAVVYLSAHYLGEVAAIVFLAVGLVLQTTTEMLTSAGEWVVSIELADDAHRGKYLSVFSLGGSLCDALGPTIVTSVLALGQVWLWPVIAALVCVGALGSAAIVGRVPAEQTRAPVAV